MRYEDDIEHVSLSNIQGYFRFPSNPHLVLTEFIWDVSSQRIAGSYPFFEGILVERRRHSLPASDAQAMLRVLPRGLSLSCETGTFAARHTIPQVHGGRERLVAGSAGRVWQGHQVGRRRCWNFPEYRVKDY